METKNTVYKVEFDALPDEIPIFPLDGAVLLPGGQLPLNIFERRYVAMVEDVMRSNRIIGMIQSRHGQCEDAVLAESPERDKCAKSPSLYKIGCAGKITAFEEMEDDRYLITLSGLSRFEIESELEPRSGYRRVRPDWKKFQKDFERVDCINLDRDRLKSLLAKYFDQQGISCNGDIIDEASDSRIVTCLSMICPLETSEKQALLEAPCCKERADLFMTILEMAIHSNCDPDLCKH